MSRDNGNIECVNCIKTLELLKWLAYHTILPQRPSSVLFVMLPEVDMVWYASHLRYSSNGTPSEYVFIQLTSICFLIWITGMRLVLQFLMMSFTSTRKQIELQMAFLDVSGYGKISWLLVDLLLISHTCWLLVDNAIWRLFLDNSIHKDTLNMVLVWFTEMTNKNILIPYLRLSRKSDHSETPYKILRSH